MSGWKRNKTLQVSWPESLKTAFEDRAYALRVSQAQLITTLVVRDLEAAGVVVQAD